MAWWEWVLIIVGSSLAGALAGGVVTICMMYRR